MSNLESAFLSLLGEARNICKRKNNSSHYFLEQFETSFRIALEQQDQKYILSRIVDYLSQYGGMGSLVDEASHDEQLRPILRTLYDQAIQIKNKYSLK